MSKNKKPFAGKIGKTTLAFVLGAMLTVSVSAAMAQSQNPPAGDINATFDSVTADRITSDGLTTRGLYAETLDFERIRTFMSGDAEIYLYPDNTGATSSNGSFMIVGTNSATSDTNNFRLINTDLRLERNSKIECQRDNYLDPDSCEIAIENPTTFERDLNVVGNINTEGSINTGEGIINTRALISPSLVIGADGLSSNRPNGSRFVDPIRFVSPVEFYSPVSGQKGVGSSPDRPFEIDGDLKLINGSIRNGDAGGADMVTINDAMFVAGSIFSDAQIGTTFKVTDRNTQAATSTPYSTNTRVEVTATCPSGTRLMGCSGYLWEEPGQARFEYMGAEKSGQSCRSYARRISSSDTNFSHYAEAICFDPGAGSRNDIVEF